MMQRAAVGSRFVPALNSGPVNVVKESKIPSLPHIRAVAFDCFGTLLHIRAPLNPWKALLGVPRQDPCAPKLDPRREPIPSIEEFAAAYGVGFRPEWRRDLDAEIASIEAAPEAVSVLQSLRAAGFRLALASNLAPAYVPTVQRMLGDLVDVTCFSCDADITAVKPEAAFFQALKMRLGFTANSILMVGDSVTSDIHGAQVAGMHALHLVPGSPARSAGQVRTLSDIPSILGVAGSTIKAPKRPALDVLRGKRGVQ